MTDLPNPDTDSSGGGGILDHLPAILWQRRWLVIIPFFAIGIVAFAASFFLPTVYRSSATFLVESQEIPQDVVSSPVTSLIDQRVARLEQQVLSRAALIDMIQRHNLYPDQRGSRPLSEIIATMRENTQIEAISADIGQQNAPSSIAYSMSFDYEDPVKAYLVMQNLADRFLELAVVQTREQAENTVRFLSTQVLDLQRQIAALERQITGIKSRNGIALSSAGVATPSGTTGSYDAQIAALQRENTVLAQQASVRTPEPRDPGVVAAEAQLAGALAIYSNSHPDVRIARQRLEEAQRLAAANRAPPPPSSIPTQIAANNAQIAALVRARSQESSRISSVSSAQARAPVVMEQIAQLENRASALREQHQATSTRLLNAQNYARMQAEEKGERLTMTDPPVVPENPISPGAFAITVGGLAAGFMAGVGLALLIEMLQKPIRGIAQVEATLGSPPLVVVPTLRMGADPKPFSWIDWVVQSYAFWRRSART